MQPHNKRRIRFVLKCFFLLLVVTVLAGIAYEQLGRRRDRERFPQVGRSVDIGGRSLNIYCSGEGSPAVILDYGRVRPRLREFDLSKADRAVRAGLLVRSRRLGLE